MRPAQSLCSQTVPTTWCTSIALVLISQDRLDTNQSSYLDFPLVAKGTCLAGSSAGLHSGVCTGISQNCSVENLVLADKDRRGGAVGGSKTRR